MRQRGFPKWVRCIFGRGVPPKLCGFWVGSLDKTCWETTEISHWTHKKLKTFCRGVNQAKLWLYFWSPFKSPQKIYPQKRHPNRNRSPRAARASVWQPNKSNQKTGSNTRIYIYMYTYSLHTSPKQDIHMPLLMDKLIYAPVGR